MTGELTLTGRVLPIGGVKEKVLGAVRAGISEIILPAENEADLEDIPDPVRETLTVHLVHFLDDVIEIAVEPAAKKGRSAARRSVAQEEEVPSQAG
jgi:ATP-dependent Lon protease